MDKIIQYNGKLLRWNNGIIRTEQVAPTPTPSYPTTNLISRYDFNDTLADTYGSNNGWTTPNAPAQWTYGTGLINKDFKTNATTTNGTSKMIKNTTDGDVYNITSNSNWSISSWIKLTNSSGDYTKFMDFSGGLLLAFGGNSYPGAASAGYPFIYYGGIKGTYSADMRDSAWHHYVWVDNATTLRLYVDNVERISVAAFGINTNAGVGLGAQYSDSGSWALNGEIDLLYFYDKALDTDEIAELYNGGSGV